MTTFRPSAQALIWIRVDELGDTQNFDQAVAARASGPAGVAGGVATQPTVTAAQLTSPAESLNEVVASLAQLEDNRRDGAMTEAEYQIASRSLTAQREILLEEQQSPNGQPRPWILLGASPDRRYGRFGIQPLSCEIHKNGYRTADTATMSIDWRKLPFDPRIIRAAAVEIVVGVVDEENFLRGSSGQIDPSTGLPLSVIAQNPGATTTTSSTRFAGWVDEWGISFGDDYLIELQFRDFTSLFIDTSLDSDHTLNLDLPIDKAIAAMIANYTTLAGFRVRYIAVPGQTGDPPAPILGTGIPLTSRSRRGRNATAVRSGNQTMSVWDHITDACVAVGLVPVIRDYELHIVQPVTQYRTQDVRRMVFGRNLNKLDFSRKLGGTKVPTIEVRAYDPTLGRVRWARWPVPSGSPTYGVLGSGAVPRALRGNELSPSGARPENRVQTYVLRPSTDGLAMVAAARSMFEQIGRQEIEGSLETAEVSSWDIENDEPRPIDKCDLLGAQSGDAIEILVAPQDSRRPQDGATTPGEWVALERSARTRFLESIGMSRTVAEQISALQDVVSSLLFRVSDVQIDFDSEDGIKVKVDFANFIEVRELRSNVQAELQSSITAASTPAARAAAANAGLTEVIESILGTDAERQRALDDATKREVLDGYPVPTTPEQSSHMASLVENQIALNNIAEG